MIYYNEHGFQSYIELYKKQITDLWKACYLPTNQEIVAPVDELQDDLVAYVFKKRKIINQDELESYLKDPPADPYKIKEILTWWKVNYNKFFI
jgi:hypothetical protein